MDRFAQHFQERCGVTIGRPNYIFGQFRETANRAMRNTETGFVVLSHHSLFVLQKNDKKFHKLGARSEL